MKRRRALDLTVIPLGELLRLRGAASEAIEAMAWYDMQVADVGFRQCDAEWSAAAETLRKIDAERRRRDRASVQ